MIEELKERCKNEFSGYSELAGGKNYRYHHQENVRKIADALADKIEEDVDRKVLNIASLFHDIGRAEDIEDGELNPFSSSEGHGPRGAKIVEKYISDFVTEEELEKIEKIIRNHHAEPETVEGKVLQDADELSSYGANDTWRQFHFSAQKGRELSESLEYFWNEAVEEYENRLDLFRLPEAREAAKQRLERHKQVMKNIEKETNAEDI